MYPEIKIILAIFIWLILSVKTTSAQEMVSSSGDFFKNSSGSIAFTLGEVATETLVANQNILTQGFHQTNLTVSAIDQLSFVNMEISVFPNPVKDWITIQIDGKSPTISGQRDTEIFRLFIFNLEGKQIFQKNIDGATTEISFKNRVPSPYILKIKKGESVIRTFKILKQ